MSIQAEKTEKGKENKDGNDFYDVVGKVVDMIVKIVGIVPYAIARLLENFISHERSGIRVLGGALLIIGVSLTSDGVFQAFGGKPLFPWWEDTWIGWGWLIVWAKINFWAAIVVSLAMVWVESWAIRGKSPNHAMEDYNEVAHHTVPAKKDNAIDLVEVRRKQYKRAGMNERSVLGIFIIMVIILDIAATFNARTPFGKEPFTFIGISIYNSITLISGEVGFALWRKANKGVSSNQPKST